MKETGSCLHGSRGGGGEVASTMFSVWAGTET